MLESIRRSVWYRFHRQKFWKLIMCKIACIEIYVRNISCKSFNSVTKSCLTFTFFKLDPGSWSIRFTRMDRFPDLSWKITSMRTSKVVNPKIGSVSMSCFCNLTIRCCLFTVWHCKIVCRESECIFRTYNYINSLCISVYLRNLWPLFS